MATEGDSVTFGASTKGRPTVIYKGFEYVTVRENKNGEIYWRCKMYQATTENVRWDMSRYRPGMAQDKSGHHTCTSE